MSYTDTNKLVTVNQFLTTLLTTGFVEVAAASTWTRHVIDRLIVSGQSTDTAQDISAYSDTTTTLLGTGRQHFEGNSLDLPDLGWRGTLGKNIGFELSCADTTVVQVYYYGVEETVPAER